MRPEILRLHLVNRVVSGPSVLAQSGEHPAPPEDKDHRRDVLKSHEQIYQAIVSGGVADAKREMEEHIQANKGAAATGAAGLPRPVTASTRP